MPNPMVRLLYKSADMEEDLSITLDCGIWGVILGYYFMPIVQNKEIKIQYSISHYHSAVYFAVMYCTKCFSGQKVPMVSGDKKCPG